ncbi:MAG: L,D-transpeptidase [Bacteroidetes bacterium]|nr:L,D-transpeptidase [Bacteroidota bacterium]MBL6944504.1 L,D-transpeptidase [Bacteroidales bacterium]
MNTLKRILQPEYTRKLIEIMNKYNNGLVDFVKITAKKLLFFLRSNLSTILVIVMIVIIPIILRIILMQIITLNNDFVSPNQDDVLRTKKKISMEISNLDKKLTAKTPKSYYLVINTASNEFSLYKGTQLIKTDKCSTGSYILLKNGDQQQWMFSTPKGEFRIQSKTTSPVWKKPDWAFVEEGLPVPSVNHNSRFEYGVLGDYALNLGHGYLIHGTLYQRFLGLPVTHGCIRLNDENLELVYSSLLVGSKVYIY